MAPMAHMDPRGPIALGRALRYFAQSQQTSPGADPLAPTWKTGPLGGHQQYHHHHRQAFTLDGTDLDQAQDILFHCHDDGAWPVPTFVSTTHRRLDRASPSPSPSPPPVRVCTSFRTCAPTHNNARSPEIRCSPPPHGYHHHHHHHHHFRFANASAHPVFDDGGLDGSLRRSRGSSLDSRSLTAAFDADILAMTTAASSAPGSPPDLSGDRSSKSSSYSSTFSHPDGLESDITNFEEIGLDDHDPLHDDLATPGHLREISIHSSGSQQELMRLKDAADKRSSLPQLHIHAHARTPIHPPRADVPLPRMPPGPRSGVMKRGFTTPMSFGPSTGPRPRSSSPPTTRVLASASTTNLVTGGLRPHHQSHTSSLGILPRRASWQPHRKSVQELEAEYHDSDDDLPDDASLWNVPISPCVSGHRSHRSSFRGSPERDPLSQSPRPIPLAHAKTAPDTPPRATLHSHAHAHALPKNRPPQARTIPLAGAPSSSSSPPRTDPLRTARTKSWNLVLADLDEEARIISEALQYHADAKEHSHRESLRGGPSVDSLDTSPDRSRRGSSIQLPPVQKSTLDFMPISKEKEAILSRTRPSWLPPKDPKEERRHLREYQRMMAASVEAENKRRAKLQADEGTKDGTHESLKKIWHFYVEDSTDLDVIDKRVNELCWRGITPSLRGLVWRRALGNPLGLTAQTYEVALQRAKALRRQAPDGREPDATDAHTHTDTVRCFVDIERDAETAFPDLNLFQRHGPLWQDLVDLCGAYACYRSDVGHIYGVQLIAALLLLQLPTPADAFILLANCLNRPVPLAFQTGDAAVMNRTYGRAVSTLAVKCPRLHEYLFGSVEQGGLAFRGDEIFEPMMRTLFANGLDIDRLCRVWDVWVFEGDRTLIRAAVAILGSLQSHLLDVQGDLDLKRRNIQEMLGWGPFNRHPQSGHWNMQSAGTEEQFVQEVLLAGTLDYTGK